MSAKSVKIPDSGLYVKKYNKNKKNLANIKDIRYTEKAVTLIAVKREVAADSAGFPWSECQVMKLATSHCTDNRKLPSKMENRVNV